LKKTNHQITAVIVNKVSLFLHEIISVNANKTKPDVFIISIVLRRSHWYLYATCEPIFIFQRKFENQKMLKT